MIQIRWQIFLESPNLDQSINYDSSVEDAIKVYTNDGIIKFLPNKEGVQTSAKC